MKLKADERKAKIRSASFGCTNKLLLIVFGLRIILHSDIVYSFRTPFVSTILHWMLELIFLNFIIYFFAVMFTDLVLSGFGIQITAHHVWVENYPSSRYYLFHWECNSYQLFSIEWLSFCSQA
jgi:hypothetical protein